MQDKYTFLELKKAAKKARNDQPCCRLAIVGDFATQHLAVSIKGYACKESLPIDILDNDYDQYDAQLMDPESETYKFAPEFLLFATCAEKLYKKFCELPLEQRKEFADYQYERIENYWNTVEQNSSIKILQMNYEELNDGIGGGNYAGITKNSFLYQLRKLNFLLMEGIQKHKNIFLIDICMLAKRYGEEIFHDPKFYYIAKIPFSQKALVEIAGQVVQVVQAVKGNIKKCVITDLDNTIWGGVIGDDGLEGIQIGELGNGQAFSDLQLWLKELKNRGILLGVCSKNNEETAKRPFELHPEMTLRLDDFAIFIANWDDKATNIAKIQKTLNIAMDSIVFLDDNPMERDLVKAMHPSITVPELPEDPALYLTYLKKCDLFETVSCSEEDKNRTQQYQEEEKRRNLSKRYENYEEYLEDMQMVAEAKPFDSFNYPRIAQLTQRSNQFNLRTVRYTEEEIKKIAENEDYLTLYFTLKDKLGNYGLISVVTLKKLDKQVLFIENWLMSCRVLKRSMEEFIVNKIMTIAEDNGFETVIGEYKKTPKNAMVENIYEKMGFCPVGNGQYRADVKMFQKNRTYIREEN